MFNVTVKGNVRCNGLHPSGPGGMVKRNIQSSTMSPNRGHSQHQHQHHHHHQTITDSKLKFSDRLKAYLSKDGLRSDASELDDPYTFSDCEIKTTLTSTSTSTATATATTITTLNHNTGHTTTLNHNHNSNIVQVPVSVPVPVPVPVSVPVQVQVPVQVPVPVPVRNKVERIHKLDTLQQNNKKVIKVNNTTTVHHHNHHNHVDVQTAIGTTTTATATAMATATATTTIQATNISNNINVNNPTLSIKNSSDNHNHTTGSGKTMSRLQAQIARNKVTVKHNRNSPDLKIDKNYFDKNTKHSIIGLVNNVNSNNKINRRLPSGKPIPAHLRARRVSKNSTSTQDSLQRISSNSSSINHHNHSNHFISSNSPKTTTNKCSLRAPSNARWHAPQPYGPLAGCRTSITPGKSKIDVSDSDEDEGIGIYQRHWFNKELEILSSEESSRESRLEITRQELKRQLLQMKRSKIGSYRTLQSPTKTSANSVRHYISTVAQSLVIEGRLRRRKRSPTKAKRPSGLMLGRNCEKDGCTRVALPCTKHCVMHIMNNQDQVLFDHCTAKFADNTQCSVPVFDITHELPLCIEHARKRDNYNRMCLETKPKKPRRKIKPSAMIRPQKRNKKRKRSTTNQQKISTDVNIVDNTATSPTAIKSTLVTTNSTGDQDVVEQVLAMQEEVGGDLELVVEQTLVTQASRLLEETDFTNVLNQIPADEFNDLFAVDRNGEYEPSREETEELERALEAVDKDVQSLEKLSATQGLLDSLLDEHTLVESLVQIPDVFHHNGYEVIDSPASHQSSPRQLQAFHHPAIHGVDGILPVQPPQAHAHAPS